LKVEEQMSVIVLAGMIGAGKTTLTTELSEYLGTKPFYESVQNNPVLPLFYKDPKRYGYLLQTWFLATRLEAIKNALAEQNNVLDRSIYEDSLFFHVNAQLGRATAVEVQVYDHLLAEMMTEIKGMPKKAPDLMVYIKTDYATMMKHIEKRGRDFEQPKNDSSLPSYYRTLLAAYEPWYNNYHASPKMMIDGTKYDFGNNLQDREFVLQSIKNNLV
jgi:deoxyadenosine/deoxycytidine kinase